MYEPDDQGCPLPPDGWWCSRKPGHEGPCAARPRLPFGMPLDCGRIQAVEDLVAECERALPFLRQAAADYEGLAKDHGWGRGVGASIVASTLATKLDYLLKLIKEPCEHVHV